MSFAAHRHAAIHVQDFAGYEGARRRSEEDRGLGNFVGLADASQGNCRNQLRDESFAFFFSFDEAGESRGFDRAGADNIYANAAIFEFIRPGAGEGAHRRPKVQGRDS